MGNITSNRDSNFFEKRRPSWTYLQLQEFFAVLSPILELNVEIKDFGETQLFSLKITNRDYLFNKENLYFIEKNIKLINHQLIYYKDLREFEKLKGGNLESPSYQRIYYNQLRKNKKLKWGNLESPSEALDWGDPWYDQNVPYYPIKESRNSLEIAAKRVIFIKTFVPSSDLGISKNRKVWAEWADFNLILKNELEEFSSILSQMINPTFIIKDYLELIHTRIQFIQKNLVIISNKMPISEKKSRLKRLIDLSVSLSISISNKTEIVQNDLLEIKQTRGSISASISSNLIQVKNLTDQIPTSLSQLRNKIADLMANFEKMKTSASVVNNHLLHLKNRLKLQNKLLFEIQKELIEILIRF